MKVPVTTLIAIKLDLLLRREKTQQSIVVDKNDSTQKHGSTQSNLENSLRSYVYYIYYVTGHFRIKSGDLTPFLHILRILQN